MTRHYRTYDRAWNRTGWSDQPSYPGQQAITRDFPLRCQCGAGFHRVIRDLASDELAYIAFCASGHATPDRPIASLIGTAR